MVGTQVFDQSTGTVLASRRGPIFANIVLADEINRAPAKVQAALLEAMQEKQVTIGGTTFKLEEPFLVLATQNPIEQEGTYPLPEAQVDRFMLKLRVGYPTRDEEKEIMRRMAGGEPITVQQVAIAERDHGGARTASPTCTWTSASSTTSSTSCTRRARRRRPGSTDLAPLIEFGASPRATISLAQASRAHAFLRGRAFVTPDDVKAIAPDVLRHRVLTTYEAEAEEVTSDTIVAQDSVDDREPMTDRGTANRDGERRKAAPVAFETPARARHALRTPPSPRSIGSRFPIPVPGRSSRMRHDSASRWASRLRSCDRSSSSSSARADS